MKARPKEPYRYLGTMIVLDVGTWYEVVHATNQPDWEEKKLVFILENLEEPDNSMGCLLTQDEVELEPGVEWDDVE